MNDSKEIAVILFSGGLDSATVLAIALNKGRKCHALTIDYGQKHRIELEASQNILQSMDVESQRIVKIDLSDIAGSSLIDPGIEIETSRSINQIENDNIPATYVPARNTVFLSVALSLAETLNACEIWCGVNAVDYSGYPDCRPEFVRAFETLANLGTRAGVTGSRFSIVTPLISMSKAEIIRTGTELGVDYSKTVTCYRCREEGLACGACDACILRRKGFMDAGIPDPTPYASCTLK